MNKECGLTVGETARSEELHRSILKTAMDGFWMADAQGFLLEVNDSYCKMSGYSEAELLTMRIADLDDLEMESDVVMRIKKVLAHGADRFETRHRRKDGSIFDVEVSTKYLKNYGEHLIVFLRDITERKRSEELLHLFKETVENSSDAVAMATPEGKHFYQNEAFKNLFGEVTDNSPATVYVDENVSREVFETIMAGGQWTGEAEMYAKDRSVLKIHLRAYANKDASGRIIGLVGIHSDITKRRRSEVALRESESYIKAVLDNLPIGIAVNSVDPSVTFQYMNDSYPRCYRTTREALADPDAFWNAVYEEPEFRDEIRSRVLDDCASGDPARMHWVDVPITRRGEETTYVEARNPPLPEKRLMVSTVWDVTGRKKADEALRESENRLRFALEGTNDGLWDVQIKTGKKYLSPRSYEILGYQPDETAEIARIWSDLVHPDDLPLTNERLKAHLAGQAPIFEVEQRLRMKSGEWKWVLARGKVVARDMDGKPLRVTGTHTDLTEKKKLETQLHHSQKLESIGRLAGGVAHDFNNMLSVILGYTYLALKETDPNQALHAYLTEIHKSAERSADLTRQLLTFARRQTIAPTVLDLNETVTGMLKMLQRLIGEEIHLNWQPEAKQSQVKVDPSQIDQILANLCVNARDATTGVGMITIKTVNSTIDQEFCATHEGIVPGEYVRLDVSDGGCGMGNETLAHIFEPFFTTKGIGEGSGLGLATVYGAVKQNNGFIYVNSEPGSGTTFSIYLPLHAGNVEQVGTENAAVPAPRGQETILLVEDETAILELAAMILKRQGYTVLPANIPGDAIRLAREHAGEIHLLVTDVVMPEMNGRDLAQNLLSLYPRIRLLFMSGYTDDVIAHHGVLDEGVHFIQKPFSLPALAIKVREVLDSK